MHAAIRSSGVWLRPPPGDTKDVDLDMPQAGAGGEQGDTKDVDLDMPQAGAGDDRGGPVGKLKYFCGTCSAWHVRDQFLPTAVNDWLGP